MFALTVALVVTTVLSFSFASTRRIGLLSIALLAFCSPTWLSCCSFSEWPWPFLSTFPRRNHHEL
jgi:hypothetical protein